MDDRTVNLVGALALACADDITSAVKASSQQGASAPAALITLLAYPNETVDALSKVLRLTGSGTVRLVDRLVAAGFVERCPGHDGRSVALRLTSIGERAAEQSLADRRAVVRQSLAPLTFSEQNELGRLVEKILHGITRDRRHADFICRLCDYDRCPQDFCPVEQAVI
jgi:MarR family transcriptional repressor of emrRAB